jgi:hypothetical protein
VRIIASFLLSPGPLSKYDRCGIPARRASSICSSFAPIATPQPGRVEDDQMGAALKAGLFYFLLVFAAGFVLGTLRVMLVEPRFGAAGAVAVELPIMLTLSWITCRALLRRFAVPGAAGARLAMGGTALGLLLLAETAVGVLLLGRDLSGQIGSYRATSAQLGLAAQVVFAALPLVMLRRR